MHVHSVGVGIEGVNLSMVKGNLGGSLAVHIMVWLCWLGWIACVGTMTPAHGGDNIESSTGTFGCAVKPMYGEGLLVNSSWALLLLHITALKNVSKICV